MKKPIKKPKTVQPKKVATFNKMLPKKAFQKTKIKDLPATNRTIYA